MIRIDISKKVKASDYQHTWVQDIQYFEGPILSLLKASTFLDYFYLFCDFNQQYNRWLAIPVTRDTIQGYRNGITDLRAVLFAADESIGVGVVDIDSEYNVKKAWKLKPSEVPDEYVPEHGSFYDPSLAPDNSYESLEQAEVYQLNVAGDWFLEDLFKIPKAYSQLYTFIYTLKNAFRESVSTNARNIFSRYPWRGGFSSVNFYSELNSVIPSMHEPKLEYIHYASPGDIKLEMLESIGVEINSLLQSMSKNQDILHKLNSDISKFLREQKLSEMDGTRNPIALMSKSTRDILGQHYVNFSRELGFSDYTDLIRSWSGNDLVALKILRAFYNRARDFIVFHKKGMIEF